MRCSASNPSDAPHRIASTPDGVRDVHRHNRRTHFMMLTSGKTPTRRMAAVSCLASVLVCAGAARATAQSHAYVANANTNSVDVITAAGVQPVPPIEVGLAPTQVVISADGSRAFVTNTGSTFLSVIDTATDTVLDQSVQLTEAPSSIALSPDGTIVYVL